MLIYYIFYLITEDGVATVKIYDSYMLYFSLYVKVSKRLLINQKLNHFSNEFTYLTMKMELC